jgi:hypothetical protein
LSFAENILKNISQVILSLMNETKKISCGMFKASAKVDFARGSILENLA